MYKVFLKNRTIILRKNGIEKSSEIVQLKKIDELSIKLKEFLYNNEIQKIIFEYENIEELWKNFRNNFKNIEAAGGVIFNKKNEFLYIERRGFIDLPKGKREQNESIENTALREVNEECGISELQIIEQLPQTYHIYENNTILKTNYWFKMNYSGNQSPIPQLEEEISKVVFADKKTALELSNKSFPSLRPLFEYIYNLK